MRRLGPSRTGGSRPMSKLVRPLDHTLMGRSARMHSAPLDRALVALTRAANYSQLWLGIAAMLVACGGRRGRLAAEHGLAAVVIAAAIANGPAKLLVRRRRPSAHPPALIRVPPSTSFPSGHSASAFAFTTGVCAELPALAPLLAPLAAAVAYSRVHTGVHYPSDILAGATIGIGSGLLAPRVLRTIRTQARERARVRYPL
jgi:membrane-associated phospholipid phosphatase